MTTLTVNEPRLQAFLAALPNARDEAFCSPPGLGGVWRVRIVKGGLLRNILKVHWSGRGLCYAAFPTNHGVCENCAAKRSLCDHCSCATCTFDRLAEERNSGPIPKEKVAAMLAKIRTVDMSIGRKAVEPLDAI